MKQIHIEFIDNIGSTSETNGSKKFCEWVKIARAGEKVVVGEKNISCPLALYKLGYGGKSTLESTLVSWEDADNEKVAKRYLDNTITLPNKKVIRISQTTEEPDLTVLFGKPDGIMETIRDYSKMTGKRIKSKMSGIGGMCGELVAVPYVEGEPNLSVGCSGSRCRAFKRYEIGLAFPGQNKRGDL